MPAPRALLSVSDKTGILELATGLRERAWEILSTGGTARVLRDGGIEVTEVQEVTGHPEMMEGRVKTLHPAVHAGILARRGRPDDLDALEAHGYGPIDLVAVNLYPFRETVALGGVEVDEAMEQVDIGGPTMIRSAAKNHRHVWVVVDPADYGRVLDALDRAGGAGAGESGGAEAGADLRLRLAAKVFRHTAAYDGAVAAFLGGHEGKTTATGGAAGGDRSIPGRLSLALHCDRTLRYGENPDQEAGFYVPESEAGNLRTGLASLRQLHGRELSYNNLLDLDGALLSLSPFALSRRPVCAIIKHTTPCGLAAGEDLEQAYRKALRTDPMSSFGSVIAVNRKVDRAAAEALDELFVECLVAPGFDADALEVLTRKKNVRLLEMPEEELLLPYPSDAEGEEDRSWWWEEAPEGALAAAAFLLGQSSYGPLPALRSVYGGMLAQAPPAPPHYTAGGRVPEGWSVPTHREPTPEEWDDLRFAWAAVFAVKSNAILLAVDGATLGIGAGQMSRVDASRIAVMKAEDAGLDLSGSALASDAFFPFRDGVDAAAGAGVRAIVQPGGSKRDEEVVAAADEHGIAMVMTGRRLFRH